MLMNIDEWSRIKHFSPEEKWGDWRKMQREIFIYLDGMRELAGVPCVIHCGYEESGHKDGSQHYIGNAVDCHFVGMDLLDQYLLAERFPWGGIGVYTSDFHPWIHVDVRPIIDNRGSRWGRIGAEYCTVREVLDHVL